MSEFADASGRWRCTKCGSCCLVVGAIPAWDRGDGYCKKLGPNNECTIYDTRPTLCRSESWPASNEEMIKGCEWASKRRKEYDENQRAHKASSDREPVG